MMKYAIVESGGKQYKAVEGGLLEVDRLPDEPGATVKLEQVLLLAEGESISVGTPLIKGTPVWTKVVEHFKGPKVVIFNYRPKKRIRVKTGHRQNYTRLLVEQIGGATLKPKPKVEEETPEVEKRARPSSKAKAEKAEAAATETKAEVVEEKKSAATRKAKPASKEKKPAAAPSKAKAAPAKAAPKEKAAEKKPAAKKTTTKKPVGKSPAKKK